MQAGELRHRITIQSKSVTRDTTYGEVVSWVTFKTVWAAKEPLSGREYLEARQGQAEATTRFRMRYLSGVLPSMRIKEENEYYDIQSVIDIDGAHRELQLMSVRHVE